MSFKFLVAILTFRPSVLDNSFGLFYASTSISLQVVGPQLSCDIEARTCVPPGIHHSMWVIWVDYIILVDPHGLSGNVGEVCLLLQLRSKGGDLSLRDQELVRVCWVCICTSGVPVRLRCVESKQRDFVSPG